METIVSHAMSAVLGSAATSLWVQASVAGEGGLT